MRNQPRIAFHILCLVSFFSLILSQIQAQDSDESNYFEWWKRVYQYELRGLPKSASNVIDSIYQLSKASGHADMAIKSIIYQSKYILMLDENGEEALFEKLKKEIASANGMEKAVLQSYTASVYEAYKNKYQYKLHGRSDTDIESDDYKTWDLKRAHQEIEKYFQESIQSEKLLKSLPVSSIKELITLEENSDLFRPTLYDFLAHRAIDYYLTNDYYLPEGIRIFEIKRSAFFSSNIGGDGSEYSKTHLYKALVLLEQLANFHQSNGRIAAYIEAVLARLKLVNANASYESAESDYLSALEQLKSQYKDSEFSTLVDYEIAQVYFDQGTNFSSDRKQRLKLRKAREICLMAESRYPKSIGVKKCYNILAKIDSRELDIRSENYIPIQQPSRLLVNYKNMDSLKVRVYKVDRELVRDFRGMSSEAIAGSDRLRKTSLVSSANFGLINDLDFQEHSTEVPLPGLDVGKYLILASGISDSSATVMAHGFVQVTNIAMISVKQSMYQLIDRNTGRPLPNAKVSIFSNNRVNSFQYEVLSDEQGFFHAKSIKNHSHYSARIVYEDDAGDFDGIYVYYNNNRTEEVETDEDIYVIPKLFTDRSIYRPGQTVFFKGILFKQQGNKKELVSNELVDVYMEDPNYDEIGEYLTLRTNEYGSFSGEFKLPKSGVTGNYTIYVEEGTDEDSKLYDDEMDDFDYIELNVSVEEYKRPRFQVTPDPIDTTYTLEDGITVTGKAMAFSGSPVTNATFSYTVIRQVQYPSWYYWSQGYRYASESKEIANGTGLTDEKGGYKVDFFPLVDEDVKKENLPVFEYQVSVDVTDLNGETRSTSNVVKCGYHLYQVAIDMPGKVNLEKEFMIRIRTTNLNDVAVPTGVEVKIYKEKYPSGVRRARPWEAPDRPIMSEKEFYERYPNDSYADKEDGEKGALVFSGQLDTALADSLMISPGLDWPSGKYIVLATTIDSTSIEVVEQKVFEAHRNTKPKVSDNQRFIIRKDKHAYHPGDKVTLTLGTAAPELNVTLFLKANNKLSEIKVVRLENEIKTVTFTLPKNTTHDTNIQYSYACLNSYETATINIPIKKASGSLKILTETFRDRLVPGGEETWSFSISDEKGKKANAELLASMYDKSLDEFKSHRWQFNTSDEYFNGYNYGDRLYLNGYRSFGTSNFRMDYSYRRAYNYFEQRFRRLGWFGFNLANVQRANKRYLMRVQSYYESVSQVKTHYDATIKKGFISGKVTDSSGSPAPGVTITVVGTTTGTVSDINGDFQLEAKKGDVIKAAFIGFETQEITIGNFNQLEIEMRTDAQQLSEVVVTAFGVETKRSSLSASVSEVTFAEGEEEDVVFSQALMGRAAGVVVTDTNSVVIRGNASTPSDNELLYVIDGVLVDAADIPKDDIISLEILKGKEATSIYGARGANGVVIISTKSGQEKLAQQMALVKARTDLKETAFFYPHITAHKKGKYKFTFTTPESLTQWKLQLLAHDGTLRYGQKTLEAMSQKDLMVIPNPPRFLRAGDQITIQTKIANLTSQELSGQASLLLINPANNESVDQNFDHVIRTKPFRVNSKGNTSVSWVIQVPDEMDLVQYKIVAKTDDFSDGEAQVLPILSNRQLITESMPVWANGKEDRDFELKTLKSNPSKSLKHHKLTFELTENPIWYAIKSLPYLIEFPHECAEQTFARYYANVLGGHILSNNPEIKKVFESWRTQGKLESALDKNEELKAILLEETPWLKDAVTERERQARLATVIDLDQMNKGSEETLTKLFNMISDGGYPWFSGGHVSRTITQHIVSGFGHLSMLGVELGGQFQKWSVTSVTSNVKYVDKALAKDFYKLKKDAGEERTKADSIKYMTETRPRFAQIQGMYARSFYDTLSVSASAQKSMTYYRNQVEKYWLEYSLYEQAMIALILSRDGNAKATDILNSIKENSTVSEEFGVYWKSNQQGWGWYQSPIETQALLIEAFNQIQPEDQAFIEKMAVWLLRHKQTQSWPTTKSTTDAIYALLLNSTTEDEGTEEVAVTIGGDLLEVSDKEAGTGYYKRSWEADEITSKMGEVSLSNSRSNTVWGALYWQYFEDLDQVKQSTASWTIEKQLLLKTSTLQGTQLVSLSDSVKLAVGDLLTVRLVLKTDRDTEFVHLKDQRAAGLEPVSVLSQYKWQDGLGYYQSTRDTGTHFFFDRVKKGTYVFEYDLRVNNAGMFSNGIAILQSMYAPEFSGHSKGEKIKVGQ